MNILLFRHASVPMNDMNIDFHDATEGDLSKAGKRQAQQIAKLLKSTPIAEIFTSSSPRAIQTAGPLSRLNHMQPRIDSRLNEARFGIFSNLSKAEAVKRFPREYSERERDKFNYRLPEGESFSDVAQRLKSFFSDLAEERRAATVNIVVITHATVIKIIYIHFLERSLSEADAIHFANAGMTRLHFDGLKFTASLINNVDHLI